MIFLKCWFITIELGEISYFMGIEITHSNDGLVLSLRRHGPDLLYENGMISCKPTTIPMDPRLPLNDIKILVLPDVTTF